MSYVTTNPRCESCSLTPLFFPPEMFPMATPDSAPHEYIDAELTVEGLASPMDEQKLLQAFADRQGIRRMTISGQKLILEYEPVFIHRSQIVSTINAAGFRVAEVESAPASPIVDAIFEEAASHPVAPPPASTPTPST